MEKEQFLQILHHELTKRGFSSEAADRHVRSLSLTLSAEDIDAIKKMEDPAEIAQLAEGISNIKAHSTAVPADTPASSTAELAVIPEETDDDVKVYTGAPAASAPAKTASDADGNAPDTNFFRAEKESKEEPIPSTPRGRRIFWTVLICTLPITLVLLAAYFGIFGIGFAALIALIAALFAVLIGGVAIGATVSLVGIIYGIIQLFTEVSSAPGLYEIGLGLSIGGAVMLSGILIYNCAIRLLPWLIRLLKKLFVICTGKLKTLYKSAKEACFKL